MLPGLHLTKCSCFVLYAILAQSRASSIAAFEEGAGCGARQWHRVGAPGGAGPYVTGPARPKAATPGNRGPAVARAGPRIWVRHRRRSAGGASRRSIASFERDGKRETGRPGRPNSKPRGDEACLLGCLKSEWKCAPLGGAIPPPTKGRSRPSSTGYGEVDASVSERPGREMRDDKRTISPPPRHSASKTRVNALVARTLPWREGMRPPASLRPPIAVQRTASLCSPMTTSSSARSRPSRSRPARRR